MKHNTAGVCLAIAALLCASVGCSSGAQKREFTVPKALCDVTVPAASLNSLLPTSGKKLEVKNATLASQSSATCEVTVDGKAVLSVERERVNAGRSAWNVASYDHGIGHVKSGDGGTVAYVDRAAVSVIPCTQKGAQDEATSTYIRVLEPGRPDESAMKQLISGYTATLKRHRPC